MDKMTIILMGPDTVERRGLAGALAEAGFRCASVTHTTALASSPFYGRDLSH